MNGNRGSVVASRASERQIKIIKKNNKNTQNGAKKKEIELIDWSIKSIYTGTHTYIYLPVCGCALCVRQKVRARKPCGIPLCVSVTGKAAAATAAAPLWFDRQTDSKTRAKGKAAGSARQVATCDCLSPFMYARNSLPHSATPRPDAQQQPLSQPTHCVCVCVCGLGPADGFWGQYEGMCLWCCVCICVCLCVRHVAHFIFQVINQFSAPLKMKTKNELKLKLTLPIDWSVYGWEAWVGWIVSLEVGVAHGLRWLPGVRSQLLGCWGLGATVGAPEKSVN